MHHDNLPNPPNPPNLHNLHNLPWRKGVGIFLFNHEGLIWTGQRDPAALASAAYPQHYLWQMPQGGIDDGETIMDAAWRELREETGIIHAHCVGESRVWMKYDLPPPLLGKTLPGFRGQTQKWLAMRFEGEDAEVNIAGHQPAEFIDWAWRPVNELLALVVPFKKKIYQRVIEEFEVFLPH